METDRHRLLSQSDPQKVAELLLEVVPRLFRLIAVEAQADSDGPLTLTQLRTLALLRDQPRLPSTLARELGITPATASEVVDVLARRGLVERESVPQDRRLTWLRITTAGLTLLDAAQRRALAGLRRRVESLPPEVLAALELGLVRLGDDLRGEAEAGEGTARAR